MIKQLVEYIIKSLVEMPESVIVSVFHDNAKSIIDIRVASDDFKRVIGKDGAVIKAVRSVIQVFETEGKETVINLIK